MKVSPLLTCFLKKNIEFLIRVITSLLTVVNCKLMSFNPSLPASGDRGSVPIWIQTHLVLKMLILKK